MTTMNQVLLSISSKKSFKWKTSNITKAWNSVAISANGNTLIGISHYTNPPVYGSAILGEFHLSSDGGNIWVNKTISTEQVNEALISADGSIIIITAGQQQQNGNRLIKSSNSGGAFWTDYSGIANISGLINSSDGSKAFGAVPGVSSFAFSDDSGQNFSYRGAPGISSLGVSGDGNKIVYTDNSYINYLRVSTNSGASFNDLYVPTTDLIMKKVVLSYDGSIIAAATYGGKIYLSKNNGDTWVSKGVNRNWTNLVMSSDGKVFAGTQSDGKILISNDSGDTWNEYWIGNSCIDIKITPDGKKIVACALNVPIAIGSWT